MTEFFKFNMQRLRVHLNEIFPQPSYVCTLLQIQFSKWKLHVIRMLIYFPDSKIEYLQYDDFYGSNDSNNRLTTL